MHGAYYNLGEAGTFSESYLWDGKLGTGVTAEKSKRFYRKQPEGDSCSQLLLQSFGLLLTQARKTCCGDMQEHDMARTPGSGDHPFFHLGPGQFLSSAWVPYFPIISRRLDSSLGLQSLLGA